MDANPIQTIESLSKMPVMGYLEARQGRLGLYGEIMYAGISRRKSTVKTSPGQSTSAAIGLDIEPALVELGMVYELTKWHSRGGTTAIDVLGAARYWNQVADIKFEVTETFNVNGLIINKDIAKASSGRIDWVDPIVGARIRRTISRGNELFLRGDIGGFSEGSDFTWDIIAAYEYELLIRHGKTFSGLLGYRILQVDYALGSNTDLYEYDMLIHGPMFGLNISF